MKRIILFAAIVISSVVVKAQSALTYGLMHQPAFRHFHAVADTNTLQKKWLVSKFGGISTGFIAFNGGTGSFLSAPVGLQVYRPLNNNVYAFAGVSVAPSIFNLNRAFYPSGINKNNGFMNATNYGIYSTAQLGLMYINDERTFSISGSIGVSRGSYRGYSPLYSPISKNNNYNY